MSLAVVSLAITGDDGFGDGETDNCERPITEVDF